jgi:hypothetical protein
MVSLCDLSVAERDRIETGSCSIDEFLAAIRAIAEQHRPSRLPFFRNLAGLDRTIATDPTFLGQIHLIYQSAMHATRAAVYYLPHLDSPALRKRKLQIFVDDDGLPGGDTHHYQLTRAFRNIGAKLVLDDEEFGDPEELCRHLDGETAEFVPPRSNPLFTVARSMVRSRGDVSRLDPRPCRRSVGPFPAIR